MNQAQLRPPKRVYQGTVLWLAIPFVYLVIAKWWMPRLPELQRLYYPSYVKTAIVPDMSGKISGVVLPKDRTLYCTLNEEGRQAPAIDGMTDLRGLHPVTFQLTTAEYMAWLQRYIFHKPALAFSMPPLMLSGEILLVLFIAAWRIDRNRHLKFRSTPRHIRGSQLVSRAEFRKHVKGEGSNWLAARLSPKKVRQQGIGWRTEDYQEEV